MQRTRSSRPASLVALALTPAAMAGGWKSYDASMAKSWEATYNTGDAAAVAACYTEDGIRMPPNSPARTQRTRVRPDSC